VPRLVATLTPDAAVPPIGQGVWGDTRVELPAGLAGPLRDVFTNAAIDAATADDVVSIPAAAIFARLPIALLVPR
jgi:maltooligosyltrehalose synthase